jgi:hypothetical protein
MAIVKVLLPLGFLLAASAQEQVRQPIRVNVFEISKKYCEGDNEVAQLRGQLKLALVNEGPEPVLIYHYKRELEMESVAMASSLQDALEGRYLHRFQPTSIAIDIPIPRRFPNPVFARIPPLGKYIAQGNFLFYVSRRGAVVNGAVAAGRYWVVVFLRPWPHTTVALEATAQRWQKHGRLLTHVIPTGPIELTVDTDFKVEACR